MRMCFNVDCGECAELLWFAALRPTNHEPTYQHTVLTKSETSEAGGKERAKAAD